MNETKAEITFGELYEKIRADILSLTLNPESGLKEQTPQIIYVPAIENEWKNWDINP